MMIRLNKSQLTLAVLLAVCSLCLPQLTNAQNVLHIFPNPANTYCSTVQITVGGPIPDPTSTDTILVYNSDGWNVPVTIRKVGAGHWSAMIHNLRPGVYTVELTCGGGQKWRGSFVRH